VRPVGSGACCLESASESAGPNRRGKCLAGKWLFDNGGCGLSEKPPARLLYGNYIRCRSTRKEMNVPGVSRKRLIVVAGLLLWMVSNGPLSADTGTWNPGTPAGRRLKAAGEVINAGDVDSVRDFIADNYAEQSIAFFGEENLFDMHFGIFERYNGLDFHHVSESSADKEVAVFRCRLTGCRPYSSGLRSMGSFRGWCWSRRTEVWFSATPMGWQIVKRGFLPA
jgi:hypothetical protein